MKSKMQSELKEGESRRGKDEFGNEFIEKREGRIIVREYLGQKIIGKPITEIRPVGKAPDRIGVKVVKNRKGYVATVSVETGGTVESESFEVSRDFVHNISEREQLAGRIKKRFKMLVNAEITPIIISIVDKIRELEAEEERLKKKSDGVGKEQKEDITNYVIVSGLYGNSYKIPWDRFLSGGKKEGKNGGEGENRESGDKARG
jgi:hypothetical protein